MINAKPPRGPSSGTVAIILAVGVSLALNVVTASIMWAAWHRLGVDVDSGISENGTQLLTGAFGGIIGALSAYLGVELGKRVDKQPPDNDTNGDTQ